MIRPFNFTLRRRVAGRPIKIPLVGRLKVGLSGEKFLLDIFELLLPKLEGAFVDVGANLGQTLCKVKLVDAARTYYGFEPNAAAQSSRSCGAWLRQFAKTSQSSPLN